MCLCGDPVVDAKELEVVGRIFGVLMVSGLSGGGGGGGLGSAQEVEGTGSVENLACLLACCCC